MANQPTRERREDRRDESCGWTIEAKQNFRGFVCFQCGVPFLIPRELALYGNEHALFCPNGHFADWKIGGYDYEQAQRRIEVEHWEALCRDRKIAINALMTEIRSLRYGRRRKKLPAKRKAKR